MAARTFEQANSPSPVNTQTLRKAFPNAAIIRRHGPGHYTVFDEPGDAIGHPSANIDYRVLRLAQAQARAQTSTRPHTYTK